MKHLLIVLIAIASVARAGAAEELYQEQFRPRFHFSPPQQWMNDPNGMVYHDGEYHLFYQHNPYSNTWGPMHWGHTVSKNLVDWENLPIALFPDVHGAMFSGSAVLDSLNTSGFGSKSNPPLVAIFTYHDHLAENLGRTDFQTQGIAYSNDKGRSWVKYDGNPVLKNPGVSDFRDPKVFWFAPASKWVMTLATGDHIRIYSSPDLKRWTHESDFGHGLGEHGGVWECPDLLELPVENESVRKFALIVSLNPGGPNGGSGTQYFIGNFDGHRFTPDVDADARGAREQPARWLDYGTDNYAGVSWSNIPPADGRRLMIGWMNNWEYAKKLPSQRWRGAMTLPRELKLVRTRTGQQLELRVVPIAELRALRTQKGVLPHMTVRDSLILTKVAGISSQAMEIELDLNADKAQRIDLTFSNANNERTVFRIDRQQQRYELDRSQSGVVEFNDMFPKLQTAPLRSASAKASMRIFVDASSIEIFLNEGATVFTSSVFPRTPYDTLTLQADRAVELTGGSVYGLRSIWKPTPAGEP